MMGWGGIDGIVPVLVNECICACTLSATTAYVLVSAASCPRHGMARPALIPPRQSLQGASTTFQPLSGKLRGSCHPAAAGLLMRAALLHDKATVALYRRPAVRMLFTIYLLMVHLAVLL